MEEEKKLITINHDCPFCGQSQLITIGGKPEDFTVEELRDLAAGQCDCFEAKAYQKKEDDKIVANSAINRLFKNESLAFRDFLHEGVDVIANCSVTKITAVDDTGVKAILTRKEKFIRVERVVTEKQVVEDGIDKE